MKPIILISVLYFTGLVSLSIGIGIANNSIAGTLSTFGVGTLCYAFVYSIGEYLSS